MKAFPLTVLLVAVALPLWAQKMATPTGEAPGPWILGTIGVGKGEDPKTPKITALKGMAIKVGEHGEAAVAYDLDLCRMVGAWTGKFTTPMNLMSRGDYPTALGEVAFTNGETPGFLTGTDAIGILPAEVRRIPGSDRAVPAISPMAYWKDPRPEPFGPLPAGLPRFKGFYVNGNRTILKWDIGGTEVLEMPGYEKVEGRHCSTRTFKIGPSREGIALILGKAPPGEDGSLRGGPAVFMSPRGYEVHRVTVNGKRQVVAALGRLPEACEFLEYRDPILVRAILEEATEFTVLQWKESEVTSKADDIDGTLTKVKFTPPHLADLLSGGPAHWPEPVVTQGEVSGARANAAYVVDTVNVPEPNPWAAPMYIGGFDFFPDGRAAVCTFHGDVFIVSGLDDTLGHVTWRRFATGLYHALGLKIVNGDVYVTCRDGLWRLRDLNGDGEADSYEAFNFDIKVTKNFHEFVFDLQTDPAGNFYFAKAGPVKNGGRGFDEIMAHHGTLMRVSPDGAKLDVIATGFRAPNGIGCGPHGELTTGDNEGTWTPVCRLNWIQPGGFYGVVPLAHRTPPPTDYDRPLCWMPKRVDNSSGGQVWVPDDNRWGPWRGQLLHLSYGTCSVFGVVREEVSGANVPSALSPRPATVQQGGVVRFPVNFQSGIMRARFNPQDGQLYVAGLRGWQTTAAKNGCFQRVRYQPGVSVRMPIGLHATKRGVRLDFACELDAESAGDAQNWSVEVWNYIWSGAYGSPEISTVTNGSAPSERGKDGTMEYTANQMAQRKHDPLTVKSATVSADKKSVFLEIPEIKPVMQMAIKFGTQAADGGDVRGEVINTIHALAE